MIWWRLKKKNQIIVFESLGAREEFRGSLKAWNRERCEEVGRKNWFYMVILRFGWVREVKLFWNCWFNRKHTVLYLKSQWYVYLPFALCTNTCVYQTLCELWKCDGQMWAPCLFAGAESRGAATPLPQAETKKQILLTRWCPSCVICPSPEISLLVEIPESAVTIDRSQYHKVDT